MVGTRSLSSGAHSRDPVALPTLRLLSRTRAMRAEEGADLAHGERNTLLGLLPGEHAYLGLRREHRGFHGDRIRVGWDIVGEDQHRCLAMTHEIARHREHEIG